MYYILINTFDAGRRGRQHDMGPSRDLGSVVSSHYSRQAAEAASRKLNKEVKRGHGPSAYMPTSIRASARMFRPGTMVSAGDFEE